MRSIFVRGRVSAQTLFQDAREVRTKRRKTFTSIFFPVGPAPLKIVTEYIEMLKSELGFSNDDPLFPSTDVGRGEDRGFIAQGLSRCPWTGVGPIRRIFRGAFEAAGLPYANPHSFRDTLVRLGQRLCRTPEEWKAWSQSLRHESEATTFVGYGHVPAHRHAESCGPSARCVRILCRRDWISPP
jgi:integrase